MESEMMAWHTTKPHQGEYIVIDRIYHCLNIGVYRDDLGWMINGRWLGHDAVDCWLDPKDLPATPQRS